MMDLTKLIDLLPYYFKENDTYKDSQDKGILERFLEICGHYFEDQIVPNVESLLDNLSVENCPEHLLNYFWEWFGCIPFAEGNFIDPDKWAQYYNGFDDEETYKNKKKYWTFEDPNNPIPLSIDQKRRILKYAISLLKCRGSKVFFETMFRLYGIDLIGIYDHAVEDVLDPDNKLVLEQLPESIEITVPHLDDELLLSDNSSYFDEQSSCMQCIPVYFYIRYQSDPQLSEDVANNKKQAFLKAITNFINKYIPFNAHPIINLVDNEGGDVITNKYYIRLTNVQNGESQIACSSDLKSLIEWEWHVYNNHPLFFRVEVWSDLDPEGTNSTWVYNKEYKDISTGQKVTTDISQEYANKLVKVITESLYPEEVNAMEDEDIPITYNFYNNQYRESLKESPIDMGIKILLHVQDATIPGYILQVEVWDEDGPLFINPTETFSSWGREIRIYARYFPNKDNPNRYDTNINISPNVPISSVGEGDTQYWLMNPTHNGQYIIQLDSNKIVYRVINIKNDTLRYKVTCINDRGIEINKYEIPVGSNEGASFIVKVKPEDTSISDYGHLVLGSYITLENTGQRYQVEALENGVYGIRFNTQFKGNFVFSSSLNFGDDAEDDSLKAHIEVIKLSDSKVKAIIIPSTVRNLELAGTSEDDSLRTFRYQISLLYTGDSNFFRFTDNPVNNGDILIKVYDNLTDTNLSPNRFNWWGSDIDSPKNIVYNSTGNTGYFDITVPYKSDPKYDSDPVLKGTPYTGIIQISYRLPGETEETSSVVLYVNYSQAELPIVSKVAIIPYIYTDTGWQLDWSKYYPSIENGTRVTKATYKKSSDKDICKFSLEVDGFDLEQSYIRYDVNNSDTVLGSGTIEDVTHTIEFKDPGIYTFEDCGVTITVIDFIPDIKVRCNPTVALLESSYGQVTTRVSLNIDPEKDSYEHKVRVLKDGVDTGDILNLSNGDVSYVVTSKGIYTFRSIDAENEGFTGEQLTNTDGTFTVSDTKDIVNKIVCEPSTGTIDQDNPTASTTVKLLDKNGNEVIDSAFLIKFPDGSTQLSSTQFTTDTAGTFTFTSVTNPSVSATFVVNDNTPQPQFGGVWVNPNSMKVSGYPYTENIPIYFTAWDVYNSEGNPFETPYTELKEDQLSVSYNSDGGSLWTPIYNLISGERFSLLSDGSNNYHIIIYGLTINSDTQIRIRPALNPNYDNGRDTFSITGEISQKISKANITFRLRNLVSGSTSLNYNMWLTSFRFAIHHSGSKVIPYRSGEWSEEPSGSLTPTSLVKTFKGEFGDSAHGSELILSSLSGAYISFDTSQVSPYIEYDYKGGSYSGNDEGYINMGSWSSDMFSLKSSGEKLNIPSSLSFSISNANYDGETGTIDLTVDITLNN